MIRDLVAHSARSYGMQFLVNQRNEALLCLFVALPHFLQQTRDFAWCGAHAYPRYEKKSGRTFISVLWRERKYIFSRAARALRAPRAPMCFLLYGFAGDRASAISIMSHSTDIAGLGFRNAGAFGVDEVKSPVVNG